MSVTSWSRGSTAGRYATSAVLAVAAVSAWLFTVPYRDAEADLEAWLVRVFSSVRAVSQAGSATVWTGLGTSHIRGFNITGWCSSAPVVGAFVLFAAVLLVLGRWSVARVLAAGAAAVGVVVIANMLRLSVVVAATHFWGQSGFEIAHVYVGTMISVIGVVCAAVLMMLVVSRQRRADRG